jgi:hypothetical protein
MKVVSGGQTGVDRAALDVALELGLPCGGWCPQGRRAEDGAIPPRYPLEETPSAEYHERTEWNVRDSDATLVLTIGRPIGGTALTLEFTRKLDRSCLLVDLTQPVNFDAVREWLAANQVRTLNVAGPRASQQPQAYALTVTLLRGVLVPVG